MRAPMAGPGARGEEVANGSAEIAAVGSVCPSIAVSFAEFAAEVPGRKVDGTRYSVGRLAESSRAMGGSVSEGPSKTDRRLAALAPTLARRQASSFRSGPGRSKAVAERHAALYGEGARGWLRRVRAIHRPFLIHAYETLQACCRAAASSATTASRAVHQFSPVLACPSRSQ